MHLQCFLVDIFTTQKPGALAFRNPEPGQKLSQADFKARLGPASGLRPEPTHH